MYHEDSKSFLVFGQQLNQIITMLQMISDRNPDIQKLNDFIQNLKDLVPYDDLLNGFIYGDQKTISDEKRAKGKRDSMTLEEMMDDLQLKFMDKRNGKL